MDLAPVRITCLTPTGTHDPSKILQSHGAKAINGLTLRSRDDVDTISDEGAEASLGDADAITIGNTIVFIGRFCRSDFASEYPASPKPIEQSLLAHEVMHVWQQQHASLTGYSLMRTISEHVQYGSEVYRYGPLALKKSFFSYRLEQQARIMQDYVYWKLQGDLRYKKLEPLLREAFDVDRRAGLRSTRSSSNLPGMGAR